MCFAGSVVQKVPPSYNPLGYNFFCHWINLRKTQTNKNKHCSDYMDLARGTLKDNHYWQQFSNKWPFLIPIGIEHVFLLPHQSDGMWPDNGYITWTAIIIAPSHYAHIIDPIWDNFALIKASLMILGINKGWLLIFGYKSLLFAHRT